MSEHEHVWGPKKGWGRMTALSVARGWEPSVCVVCGETERPDSLDAAWAAAEAALPEGWHVSIYPLRGGGEGYRATASRRTLGVTPDGIVQFEVQPTPAAALRALAEKLRERTG